MSKFGWIDEESVATANEFFERLRPKPGSTFAGCIFRGLSDATFRLVPTALRPYDPKGTASVKATIREVVASEVRLLANFVEASNTTGLALPGYDRTLHDACQRLKAAASVGTLMSHWPSSTHDVVWAIAQHHGLPTRLLDWSTNPLVACYFAAAGCVLSKAMPAELAVWAMDKAALSEHVELRLVRVAASHSPNLTAQRGVFTLTTEVLGDDLRSFVVSSVDEIIQARSLSDEALVPPTRPAMIKLMLPSACAPDLLELCEVYGVSGATMFPGFDGAARAALEMSAREREQTTRAFQVLRESDDDVRS